MTRLPIEREIREALSVDPSSTFAAGVRARIAAEPEAAAVRRFGWWMWTPAAALATVALAVWLRPSHAPIAPAVSQVLVSRSLVLTTTLPSSASSFARRAAGDGRSARLQPSGTREPEILISLSESRAIRGLIAGVRSGRIDPATLPQQPLVADLEIQPIVIAPLSIDGGQGVRQ